MKVRRDFVFGNSAVIGVAEKSIYEKGRGRIQSVPNVSAWLHIPNS